MGRAPERLHRRHRLDTGTGSAGCQPAGCDSGQGNQGAGSDGWSQSNLGERPRCGRSVERADDHDADAPEHRGEVGLREGCHERQGHRHSLGLG